MCVVISRVYTLLVLEKSVIATDPTLLLGCMIVIRCLKKLLHMSTATSTYVGTYVGAKLGFLCWKPPGYDHIVWSGLV